MPFEILKLDFNERTNLWTLEIRREGRCGVLQLPWDAFKHMRANPMGQFLLYGWLGRAKYQAEAQPST